MGLIQNKVKVSQPNSHVVVKNAGGLRGLTGEQGVPGPQGVPGQAATVTVGTTTTLPAGSDATVQNVGSTSAAIFNFAIPEGDKGDTGETGAAATVSVGATTTLEPGEDATVTNSGTSSAAVFDFGIPKGAKGDTGDTGPAGQDGADGFSPTATVSKTGDTATITITDKDGTTTAQISDGITPTIDPALSPTSENPVQNKVVTNALAGKADKPIVVSSLPTMGTAGQEYFVDDRYNTVTELKGDTQQTTYSGRNINVYPYAGGGNGRGITFTANSDGTVVLNGQNDGQGNSVYFFFNNQSNPMTLPAGTYYIAPPSNTRVGFVMYDGTTYYGFSSSNGYSVTFSSSVSIRQFYVQVYHTDVTFSDLKIYPMLTTSAQHTEADWEPYVGGTASPNPSYPQEVQMVTGDQTVKVVGKNKINVANGTGTRGNNTVVASGQTVTANTSGSSGTESAWYLNDCSIIQQYAASLSAARDYHLTTEGGTYTVTVYYENMPSGTATLHCYVYTNKQAKILNRNMVEDNKIVWTVTLEADEYIKSAMVYTAAANVFSNFKTRIQIEEGSAATSYAPYQSQSCEINLGKNLANIHGELIESGAATTSVSGDSITLTTSGGAAWCFIPLEKEAISKQLTTISYAVEGEYQNVGVKFYRNTTHGSGSITWLFSGTTFYSGDNVTFPDLSAYADVGVVIYANNESVSATGTSMTYKNIQLEKGPTVTTYVPYVIAFGKNLFNLGTSLDEYFLTYSDGTVLKNEQASTRITATFGADSITINSYDTTGWRWLSKWVTLEKNTDYVISADSHPQGIRVVGFNSKAVDTTGTTIGNYTAGETDQPFNSGDYAYYLVSIYPNAANTTYSKIQIEKGSTATTYEPNMSGQLELYKAGPRQDYIYKSGENWYVKKETAKMILDGTETITKPFTNLFVIENLSGNWLKRSETVFYYCEDYYGLKAVESNSQFNTLAAQYNYAFDFTSGQNGKNIRFKDTRYDNIDNYKAWLASNNVQVYYALATATDIQITNAALIAQLEALAGAKIMVDGGTATVTSQYLPATLTTAYNSDSGYIDYIYDGTNFVKVR